MRRLCSLTAIPFMLFAVSCSDSTGPGDDGPGEVIASVTIDSQGGTAGNDNFTLDIPAGAFDDDTPLMLATAPESPFDDAAATGQYMIIGMPAEFSGDLTVTLTTTGTLSDSTYLAVGMPTWVPSLNDTETVYRLFPATVTDSTVTGTIPATAVAGVTKPSGNSDNDTTVLTVTAVTGMGPYITPGGHFKIEYHKNWNTLADIQYLGQCLEEAYSTYQTMGFSYDRRTSWPVEVTVVAFMKSDKYGVQYNTLWGYNSGCISFNKNKLSEHEQIRITAGHEFFHLVQSLYDPRNFYSRAKVEAPHLWLDEACAVWAEEKFTNTTPYVSVVRAGNNHTPLTGVAAGAVGDAQNHGYGLSAMIKYLVDEYGEQKLVTSYQNLYNGDNAVRALVRATEEPIEWWEPFLRKYVQGEIYNVGISEFIARREGMFQIMADDDTLQTFTAGYPDLSGKLYLVRLDDPLIDENSKAEFSVTGGMSEVTVFKYRTNPAAFTFAGTSTDGITVSGLRQLTDDGYSLLALVSNSRNTDPYTDSSSITLTIRIEKSPAIDISKMNEVSVSFWKFEGIYSVPLSTPMLTLSWVTVGSPTGENTFVGHGESIMSGSTSSTTVVVHVEITIDPDTETVSSFNASRTYTDDDGHTWSQYSIEGYDIPLDFNNTMYEAIQFQLIGTEVKTKVPVAYYKTDYTEMTDYTATEETGIRVQLRHSSN